MMSCWDDWGRFMLCHHSCLLSLYTLSWGHTHCSFSPLIEPEPPWLPSRYSQYQDYQCFVPRSDQSSAFVSWHAGRVRGICNIWNIRNKIVWYIQSLRQDKTSGSQLSWQGDIQRYLLRYHFYEKATTRRLSIMIFLLNIITASCYDKTSVVCRVNVIQVRVKLLTRSERSIKFAFV